MGEESIKVYARVRPCGDPSADSNGVKIDELDPSILVFNSPTGTTGTSPSQHKFPFTSIFWKDSTQPEIFETVAKPLIDSAMKGFNATLFAYGQTGSGKTFTITGDGTREYSGIVPRAIEIIYDMKKNPEFRGLSIKISYLEIYNNVAYDLLTATPGHQMNKLEDLTKVTFVDSGRKTIFKNLSTEEAPTFESAHKLFWSGESARQKAATVNNKYSSRSHTIFTFILRNETEDRTTQSQLNFVDLAGSEKFGSLEGEVDQRKREARAINMSLHNLQQVIIGINEKRSHIPFRDSALTRFLKDSLIGNVRTSMIATISTNRNHIPESISTCRFSESVSEVKMKVTANEKGMSLEQINEKLRFEVSRLREELAHAKLGIASGSEGYQTVQFEGVLPVGRMSTDESIMLKERVDNYLNGEVKSLDLSNMRQANFCFEYMKEMINKDYSSSLRVAGLTQKLKDSELKVKRLVNMMKERQNIDGANASVISKEAAFIQFRNTHEKYNEELAIRRTLKAKCKEAEELAQRAQSYKQEINEMENDLSQLEDKETEATFKLQRSGNKGQAQNMETILANIQKECSDKQEEINNKSEQFNKTIDVINQNKGLILALQKKLVNTREIVQNDFKDFWEDTILGYTEPAAAAPATLSSSPSPRKHKKLHKIPRQRCSTMRPLTPSK